MKRLWTIGHSTREFSEFLQLLKQQDIAVLVDIRSLPGSKKYPWFNKEQLAPALEKKGISYCYIPGLGGLRKKNKDSHNTVWRNASFRAYADYMETAYFEKAVHELAELAVEKKTCICCAEAVWWRCHRSMVADYLKSKGWKVFHIISSQKPKEHPYTKPAKIIKGKLIYGSKDKT